AERHREFGWVEPCFQLLDALLLPLGFAIHGVLEAFDQLLQVFHPRLEPLPGRVVALRAGALGLRRSGRERASDLTNPGYRSWWSWSLWSAHSPSLVWGDGWGS